MVQSYFPNTNKVHDDLPTPSIFNVGGWVHLGHLDLYINENRKKKQKYTLTKHIVMPIFNFNTCIYVIKRKHITIVLACLETLTCSYAF